MDALKWKCIANIIKRIKDANIFKKELRILV